MISVMMQHVTNIRTGGTLQFLGLFQEQGPSRSNLKRSSVKVSHCIIQVDPLLLKNHLSVNRLDKGQEIASHFRV